MISVKQPSNNQNQSYQIKTNSKNVRPKQSHDLSDVGIFQNAKFGFL